jgi:cobalt-zinc-cadmium resistance protein CzcA
MGADNQLYGVGSRFGAVLVGVGIPIFTKAQKTKIEGAEFSRKIAESNYSIAVQNMQTQYQIVYTQYLKQLQSIDYYESKALKNAEIISSTANIQLANGGINYLEWVQLINQSTSVKNDYIDAVKVLNELILQLNYFTNK